MYSLSLSPISCAQFPRTSMETICRRHILLGPGTSTEGWHVALDSLLIGDQSMLIDQQLASTCIPQHLGYMVFGEHCLKIQRFVCSHEETLVFVPVKQIPNATFRLVTLGVLGLCGQPGFDSRSAQTNHCMPSKYGNG